MQLMGSHGKGGLAKLPLPARYRHASAGLEQMLWGAYKIKSLHLLF